MILGDIELTRSEVLELIKLLAVRTSHVQRVNEGEVFRFAYIGTIGNYNVSGNAWGTTLLRLKFNDTEVLLQYPGNTKDIVVAAVLDLSARLEEGLSKE